MACIEFRGQTLSVEDARMMIQELIVAIASGSPELSNSPVGMPMQTISDPRWYTEYAPGSAGTLICFRDPGLGWRGFILPWASAAHLVGLIVQQMAAVNESAAQRQVH